MKPEIHPKYQQATVTCACGAVYETRSTATSFAVDICANCHPFYTGRQKVMDTAGRVERFKRKYANVKVKGKGGKKAAGAEPAAPAAAEQEEPKAE